MRTIALLSLLLVAASCATSSSPSFGIRENRVNGDCQHGDLEVLAAFSDIQSGGESLGDRLTFAVQVANNSRKDVVVKQITVEDVPLETARYRIDRAFKTFNETIKENEDHTFEIPITGRVAGVDGRNVQRSGRGDEIEVVVTVWLEGGESYRCHYAVRAPIF